jgi:hypothetical protein
MTPSLPMIKPCKSPAQHSVTAHHRQNQSPASHHQSPKRHTNTNIAILCTGAKEQANIGMEDFATPHTNNNNNNNNNNGETENERTLGPVSE